MQFDGITLASVGFTTTDLRTTSYLGGFQNSAWEIFHYLYRMRSGTEASPKKANRRVVGSGAGGAKSGAALGGTFSHRCHQSGAPLAVFLCPRSKIVKLTACRKGTSLFCSSFDSANGQRA
jgi:hypothetical protein